MSRTLIIAEHDGQALNISTAKCVSCAKAIGGEIDIAVFGNGIDAVAAEAAALDSVGTVFAVNAEHLEAPLAANWAAEALSMAADYSHLLGPSTTLGKDLMPRIAALAGVNQVSDIMEVNGPNSFKRPIYAGNAIVDVETADGATFVGTVRTASWKAAGSSGSANVEQRPAGSSPASHTRFVGMEVEGGERPDLQSAACRCIARCSGCRLLPERHAGRADRQDHLTRFVHRNRDFRRDPARYRHQGRGHYRCNQQGLGSADI